MNYPKILIVTSLDIFQDVSSSSMTVRSLIEEIPSSNVYQLICINSLDIKHGLLGNNRYCLNENDILAYPHIRSGKKKVSAITQLGDAKSEKSIFNLRHELIAFARDLLSIFPYRIPDDLIKFIREEKIQIIYTCSFVPRCYKLVDSLYKMTGIKHVCHFLDDWPNVIYRDSICSKYLRKRFESDIKEFIHNSPFSLCISELMCREYSVRYNYSNFYALMHSVPKIEANTKIIDDKITVIYAGSLYLERYKSIIEFCNCVERHDLAGNIKLIVYTRRSQWDELSPLFSAYTFLHYGGFVTHNVLMKKIQEASALLFVESLNEKLLEYTRLSMSTKIPEYLSSGKPIFAIGNIKQCSISYLKEYGAAFVADSLEDINLIFNDFTDKSKCALIVQNAARLYNRNHIKLHQQQKFLSLIESSI